MQEPALSCALCAADRFELAVTKADEAKRTWRELSVRIETQHSVRLDHAVVQALGAEVCAVATGEDKQLCHQLRSHPAVRAAALLNMALATLQCILGVGCAAVAHGLYPCLLTPRCVCVACSSTGPQ